MKGEVMVAAQTDSARSQSRKARNTTLTSKRSADAAKVSLALKVWLSLCPTRSPGTILRSRLLGFRTASHPAKLSNRPNEGFFSSLSPLFLVLRLRRIHRYTRLWARPRSALSHHWDKLKTLRSGLHAGRTVFTKACRCGAKAYESCPRDGQF